MSVVVATSGLSILKIDTSDWAYRIDSQFGLRLCAGFGRCRQKLKRLPNCKNRLYVPPEPLAAPR